MHQSAYDQAAGPETLPASEILATSAPGAALQRQILSAIDEQGFLVISGLFADCATDITVLDRMQRFFRLPDDSPIKQAVNEQHRDVTYGWMPLYGEPAYEAGTRARVESFDCGNPITDHPDNCWPDMPGFRSAAQALWRRYTEAGLAMMVHIATAIGLPPAFLREQCSTQALSTMRMLHYPGQQTAASDEVGISAHSDFECITLLYQTAPGLELRDRQGKWRNAQTAGRDVFVLFGDMLETWTNGRIRATPHRVRMTSEPRYSLVLFFAVDDGITVAPLPPFLTNAEPAYAAVTQRTHSHKQLSTAEQNRDAAGSDGS